jgi:hypothetical protein
VPYPLLRTELFFHWCIFRTPCTKNWLPTFGSTLYASSSNESFAKPNTIVRFDPQTEKFQTWAIPGGGDIVRNMDVTPDGNPVTANSLMNQVGLVEIK